MELTARALTRDYDQREDLIAEAWKVLWSQDASRCNVQDQEDLRNRRKILINRMRNYAESKAMRMDDAEGRLPEDLGEAASVTIAPSMRFAGLSTFIIESAGLWRSKPMNVMTASRKCCGEAALHEPHQRARQIDEPLMTFNLIESR
ncbi:MAG: hypothetical protein JWM95_2751 [Gemmatimonadetes bacterium]|nr:hypothetical protein [Gemmatimonadota bacterium]